MRKIITLLLFAIFPAFIFAQTITTDAASNVSFTTVTLNGTGASLDPGVSYYVEFRVTAISGNYTGVSPVTSAIFTGGASNVFTYNLTGLNSGTTYYYKTRLKYYDAIDDDWYTGGNGLEVSFTTLATTAPTLTTGTAANISYTAFDINTNNISSNGGSAITEQGVVVSTTNNPPTVTDTKITYTPLGIGDYNVSLTGLATGTTYYVRAYAINGVGTSYGATTLTQATLTPAVPSVSIGTDFTSITNNSANNTGNNATADNGSAITDKGILYATHSSPDETDVILSTGTSGLGTFNGTLTGLSQLTKYYARAYAINGIGYGYSASEKSFITKATVAADISNVISLASQQLNITYTGGSGSNCIIYMRETDQNFSNPTDGNEYTGNLAFGSGANLGGGTYVVYSGAAAKGTITVTGLDNDKDYYFRIATYSGSGASTIYDINTEIIDSEGSQLPVSLVAFGASKEADGIELNWITNSEINNQYFAIEKSIDAVFYQEIGLVNGAGNSNTVQNYTFLDQQEITGQVYYRLRQVDYDGTINYSQAIVIETSSALPQFNQVNGSETSINLILTTVSTSSVLTINDITGKEVKRINLSNSGAHQLSLSRTQLASGVYMITLSDNQNKITKKIVL